MQIQIKQNEIEKAIIEFLTEAGINTTDKQIDISFTAGRKGGGITAEVNINDVVFTPAVKTKKVDTPVIEGETEEVKEVNTASVGETTESPGYSTTAPSTLNGGLFG